MAAYKFERKKNLWPVTGSVEQTTTGKLILRVSLHELDADNLLLEKGVQPDGIFKSIIITRRKN